MPRGKDGSIIGDATAVSASSASGIWTMSEVHKYRTEEVWPGLAVGGTGANGSGSPYYFTGDGTTGTNGQLYRVHEFWYAGSFPSDAYYDHTFTTSSELTDVEYLVIAGGGSGGVYSSAGGGYFVGNVGNTSYINWDPGTRISTTGGGYGGKYYNINGGPGGSGGGGGGSSGTSSGGTAVTGEGFAGADGHSTNRGGGGGGAKETGQGNDGGDGLPSYITGASVTRAGGGAQSSTGLSGQSTGGAGGGGKGGNGQTSASSSDSPGEQGVDGTGSGGGADDHNVGASHGGGGAGGYRSSVYVGLTGETSGGGSAANAKLTFSIGSHTIRVGAGGASVGSATDALSGRGGHGIVILRYPI